LNILNIKHIPAEHAAEISSIGVRVDAGFFPNAEHGSFHRAEIIQIPVVAGIHYYFLPPRQQMPSEPENLPYQPANPVALYRASDGFFRGDYAKASLPSAAGIYGPQPQCEIPVGRFPAGIKHALEVGLARDSPAAGEGESVYALGIRLLRPFLLLALSTFLPPLVLMRARKPICFALLRLFGLYVGSIITYYIN
jgi:hypothetical protein